VCYVCVVRRASCADRVVVVKGLYAERSKGVGKAIYCVARSSDGQYLVASGCDNLVYIWQRQP
jgi:WD40 repeat protein